MPSDDDLVAAIFDRLPARTQSWDPASRRALRALADARFALDRLEAALVRRARVDGATWREVAADLGIPQTTLRERHGAARPRLSGRAEGE
jgi:DNA-directed RNA polymerase specialized sigma24 family protein